MTEIFVDTSAWYPLADTSHPDHGRLADALRQQIDAGVRMVTTNLVLAESHVLILRRLGRRAALKFVEAVREPPNVIVYSGHDLEQRSQQEWLHRCRDHGFSLTDAVSFAVMTERSMEVALALDRHFQTAGFRTVP